MSGFIVKSILSSSVFRVIGILSSFIINVLLAHMLEPKILGQYFLAFSLVMFLSIVMRFGLKQTVLRLVSQARLTNSIDAITDTIQKIMLFVAISVLVVSFILMFGADEFIGENLFHSDEITKNFTLIIFWSAMLAFSAPIGESLRGLKMPAWGAALDNSASSFVTLVVVFFMYVIKAEVDLQIVLFVSGVSAALVVIISTYKLKGTAGLGNKVSSYIRFRDIYRDTSPILIINIATYLTANASIWIVGYFLSHEDVAVYGAVLKLFNLIAVPLLVINIAIEPSISEYLHKNDRKHMDALLRLSASVALIGTLLISIITLLWGDVILSVLFGAKYIEGYEALLILMVGNLINVWTGSCASMMLLGGHQKSLTKIRVMYGVLSVVLSLILVHSYGIEGVAFTVSVTVALTNYITWRFVKTNMNFDTSATIDIKNKVFIVKH